MGVKFLWEWQEVGYSDDIVVCASNRVKWQENKDNKTNMKWLNDPVLNEF